MKITKKRVTISQLVDGYSDMNDLGVVAYNGKLDVRPCYQREYVYDKNQARSVIDSILNAYPIGVFHWGKKQNGWELIDGQQRTISICQFCNGEYAVNYRGTEMYYEEFKAKFPNEADEFANYELIVYECDGQEGEKLNWFRTINTSGEPLNDQEIRNAVYAGDGRWLNAMKNYFSKRNCPAQNLASTYVKGNPIRQDYLEKILKWCANRDGLPSIEEFMHRHNHDEDIKDVVDYFRDVIVWAKKLFGTYEKSKLLDKVEWGILYNRYKDDENFADDMKPKIDELLLDNDVTKQSGVFDYVLSGCKNERSLSIRTFTEGDKRRKYEEQHHHCPLCEKEGCESEYAYDEMEGDHIVPWHDGGHTTYDNLQMLCKRHNREKGGK